MSWSKTAGFLFFATAITAGGYAKAWGPEGHAIIAEIAEARLEPAARVQVRQLLHMEGHQHLDQVASWPDAVRAPRPETASWHFVDIPLTAPAYDPDRDCAGGNCVVAQIQRFATILGDRTAPPQARLEALKFLVHFIGDIHQPLHCETDFTNFPPPQGDRGGNDIHLTYFHKSSTLHAVWDGGIIEEALGVQLGPHFTPDLNATSEKASLLNAAVAPDRAAVWAPNGLAAHLDTATVQWANESHALAQGAYRNLPSARRRGWDQTYQDSAWPVVQEQLARGGVRLAELLNEVLR